MDSDGPVCVFRQLDELPDNGVTGRAAVDEEQVVVVEARVLEATCIVDLLVQPNDGGHPVLAEVGEVGLWGVEGVP